MTLTNDAAAAVAPLDPAVVHAGIEAWCAQADPPIEVVGCYESPTAYQARPTDAPNADVVLLDNMAPDALSQAVKIRNEVAPQVELEASGGVNLSTVLAIAHSLRCITNIFSFFAENCTK